MSTRPAIFTESDLRRAMKAAKREGWNRIEVTTPEGFKVVCELTTPKATTAEEEAKGETLE